MARLVLTQPGEDVFVGGDVTVIGTTSGGEVITVLTGTITLDASFNAGGDTVQLPDVASAFTVRLVGSTAVLVSDKVTVSIPIGTTGLQISFDDVARSLRFDTATGSAKLGDQVITGSEIGVLPLGVTAQILGTEAANTLNGTAANDVIDGLGGNDTINGLGGDDFIRGGSGDDTIDGGAGEDTIIGGAGNDRIIDNEGGYGVIDGGIGNDHISVNNLLITSLNITGGDGDDLIELGFGPLGLAFVNAGAGNDRISVATQGMDVSLLLGAGRDEVVVPAGALTPNGFGLTIIRDFELGSTGDKVVLQDGLNSYLENYAAGSNPFATGHLRLVDFFGNAYLQVDRDGPSGSAGFEDLINFAGIDKNALTAASFNGFDPAAPANAASSSASESAQRVTALAPEPEPEPAVQTAEPVQVHHDLPGFQPPVMITHYGDYYFLQ